MRQYRRLVAGERGLVGESELVPVKDIPSDRGLPSPPPESAAALLRQTAVIKLNGGLGTGMGLDAAKSLLEIRPGVRFVDAIVRHVLDLRKRIDAPLPLLFMNSFRTEADTTAALAAYPDLTAGQLGLPPGFLQNRVPKVCRLDFSPAEWPEDPDLAWCPPGHGDLYAVLHHSGLLDRMIEAGIRYAFVSNADNLAASLDPAILHHVADTGTALLMEVCRRTASDRKGGHIARDLNGRLLLRERAQCPESDLDAFENIDRHRFFNTNNIWLHLPALQERLRREGGFLNLPLIANGKPLDPRKPDSPPVWQLETAMGAAVGLFDGASVLLTGRRRFLPVKTTGDLLVVGSDACVMTESGTVEPTWGPESAGPDVDLDPACFGRIDDFHARFPHGPPSLRQCRSLRIRGDVRFGRGVILRGSIRLDQDGSSPRHIPDGFILEG